MKGRRENLFDNLGGVDPGRIRKNGGTRKTAGTFIPRKVANRGRGTQIRFSLLPDGGTVLQAARRMTMSGTSAREIGAIVSEFFRRTTGRYGRRESAARTTAVEPSERMTSEPIG